MGEVQLVLKNPARLSYDFSLKVPLSITLAELQQRIQREYDGNPDPSSQTLIYAGKVLKDTSVTLDALLSGLERESSAPVNFHLVVKASGPNSSSPAAGPSNVPPAAAAPAPAAAAGTTAASVNPLPGPSFTAAGLFAGGAEEQLAQLEAYLAGLEGPEDMAGPSVSYTAPQLFPTMPPVSAPPYGFGGFMPALMASAYQAAFTAALSAARSVPIPTASSAPAAASTSGAAPSGPTPGASASTAAPAAGLPGAFHLPYYGNPYMSAYNQGYMTALNPATASTAPAAGAAAPGPAGPAGAGAVAWALPNMMYMHMGPYGPTYGVPPAAPFGGMPGPNTGLRQRRVPADRQAAAVAAVAANHARGARAVAALVAAAEAGQRRQRRVFTLRINARTLLQVLVFAVVLYQHFTMRRFVGLLVCAAVLYLTAVLQPLRRLMQGLAPPANAAAAGPAAPARPQQHQQQPQEQAGQDQQQGLGQVGAAGDRQAGGEQGAAAGAGAQGAPEAGAAAAEGAGGQPAVPAPRPRPGILTEILLVLLGFVTSLLPAWNYNQEDAAAFAQAQEVVAREERRQRVQQAEVEQAFAAAEEQLQRVFAAAAEEGNAGAAAAPGQGPRRDGEDEQQGAAGAGIRPPAAAAAAAGDQQPAAAAAQ